jgi:anti-sigma28 factor (negative regulator of flagellin synthesis)
MTMRISDRYERFTDRLSSSKAGSTTAADKSGAGKEPVKVVPGEPSVLSVKVSDRAAQLSAGAARLDELRVQIRNGTFKVDARAIANKLVGEDD